MSQEISAKVYETQHFKKKCTKVTLGHINAIYYQQKEKKRKKFNEVNMSW